MLYSVSFKAQDAITQNVTRTEIMSDNVTAIKGFADLFSPESDTFTFMERVARDIFFRYGFTELRTPLLERTELFSRGIGTETDVVQKEMYTFPDR